VTNVLTNSLQLLILKSRNIESSPFKCDHCGHTCGSITDLDNHNRNEHSELKGSDPPAVGVVVRVGLQQRQGVHLAILASGVLFGVPHLVGVPGGQQQLKG
jgi:hypothetical protein